MNDETITKPPVPADIRAFLRKYDLSDAQLDLLRRASRKYADVFLDKGKEEKLHNGEVSSYNVRMETLHILKSRGLIESGYRVNDEAERVRMEEHMRKLIRQAFAMAYAQCGDPFFTLTTEDGKVIVWREVQGTLNVADGIRKKLAETCMVVTGEGRKIAAEWKALLGAKEE